MLNTYETRLREVNKVPDEEKELEDHRKMLQVFPLFWGKWFMLQTAYSLLFQSDDCSFVWQSMHAEAEADQAVFDRLQDDLKRATAINDKMTRIHAVHDAQLEYYRQLVDSLLERWQTVFAQIALRQRELNLLGRHMNVYHGSYDWLIRWLRDASERQKNIQALPVGDGKALNDQLAEEKVFKELIWEHGCKNSPTNIMKMFLH